MYSTCIISKTSDGEDTMRMPKLIKFVFGISFLAYLPKSSRTRFFFTRPTRLPGQRQSQLNPFQSWDEPGLLPIPYKFKFPRPIPKRYPDIKPLNLCNYLTFTLLNQRLLHSFLFQPSNILFYNLALFVFASKRIPDQHNTESDKAKLNA